MPIGADDHGFWLDLRRASLQRDGFARCAAHTEASVGNVRGDLDIEPHTVTPIAIQPSDLSFVIHPQVVAMVVAGDVKRVLPDI